MTGSPHPQESVQQVPWPSLEPPESQSATKPPSNDNDIEQTAESSSTSVPDSDQTLSTWRLVALSISMLGVQVAWTLELAWVMYRMNHSGRLTNIVMGRLICSHWESATKLPRWFGWRVSHLS